MRWEHISTLNKFQIYNTVTFFFTLNKFQIYNIVTFFFIAQRFYFSFSEEPILFIVFSSNCTTFHSHQQWASVPFSPHPHQSLLPLVFLMPGSVLGVGWDLTGVLTSISLIVSDAEHFFIYLWAFCMSSLLRFVWGLFLLKKKNGSCGSCYQVLWVFYVFYVLTPH